MASGSECERNSHENGIWHKARVKRYRAGAWFGFLTLEDTREDVFFDRNAQSSIGFDALQPGVKVEIQFKSQTKGLRATRIRDVALVVDSIATTQSEHNAASSTQRGRRGPPLGFICVSACALIGDKPYRLP